MTKLLKENIDNLIENNILENAFLEYKSNTDLDRDKIVKSFSGMANTEGGQIIFGIKENKGADKNLLERSFLELAEADEKIRGIEERLKCSTEPQLTNYNIYTVNMGDGKCVSGRRSQKLERSTHAYCFKEILHQKEQ